MSADSMETKPIDEINNLEPVENNETAMEEAMGEVEITPVEHASFVLTFGNKTIVADPVGDTASFLINGEPDFVLVTDVHGDHFSVETLTAILGESTVFIAPTAVVDELPENLAALATIIDNGEAITIDGLSIEAIPMYNLREDALDYHVKGRGNGYVLEQAGTRVYIAGDTEDIPEMRDLVDIDYAFIPMNLPYTMDVETAVAGVLAFAPKNVYPYHYRGTDGLSDVDEFKRLVNEVNPSISVQLLNWYPNAE